MSAKSEQNTILDAIIQIPGNTPGKKYHSLAKFVSNAVKNGQPISTLIETNQVHVLLSPYCYVEAARILSNHQMVAEALKSENSLVVKKALSIKSFFDGSDSEVTNCTYFAKHIIPHVSLNTRMKIINKLSIQLAIPELADEFFEMFQAMYGIEQAMPLLLACSPEFVYTSLIEKNIVLTRSMVKKFYRKNPELVIHYIKAVRKFELLDKRTTLKLNLIDFNDIIVNFIKFDIESFIEVVESYEGNKLRLKFSKTLGKHFMTIGLKFLLDNPKLYTTMLPLEVIDLATMRVIFPLLFPENLESFNTNKMLNFLEFFPHHEKFHLLERSFSSRYKKNILDTFDLINPRLMLLLPDMQRVKQAKLMMANDLEKSTYYPFCWRCYCTTHEVIPVILNDIAKTSQIEDRCALLGQMIYCCKVNKDDKKFLECLKYFNERHKNETPEIFFHFLKLLIEIYGDNLHSMSTEHFDIIDGIIRRMHVKGYISDNMCENHSEHVFRVLEASVHHKLLLNPVMEVHLVMMSHCNLNRNDRCWNIIKSNPVFEEKCLTSFIEYASDIIEEQSPSNKYWNENEKEIVAGLIKAIYDYNERHMNYKRYLVKKALSVKDYPSLIRIVTRFLNNRKIEENPAIKKMRNLMRRHDRKFFESMNKKSLADVRSGEALALLRREPVSILEHWVCYLLKCKSSWSSSKNVVRFIKTVRWHNDIAIKWRRECEKRFTEDHSYLGILGILLDGPSFVDLVKPFLPIQTTLQTDGPNARSDYLITSTIPSVCNLVDPPVPLSLIGQYFEGDYLSDGLRTSINLCRRTAVSKVLPFLGRLVAQRVSVRKHAIRLHYMVATIDESCALLSSLWSSEQHHSIQEVLFRKVHDLFLKHPIAKTFYLLKNCLRWFPLDTDMVVLLANFDKVPNQFLPEYINYLLESIELEADTKNEDDIIATRNRHIVVVLYSMDSSICEVLEEPLCMEIFDKYILYGNCEVQDHTLSLALDSFIFNDPENTESRLKLFVEMMTEKITEHWDNPSPTMLHHCVVNRVFHRFVQEFCNYYPTNRLTVQLVDLLLEMFKSTVKPDNDLQSFLYLLYTKEKIFSTSTRDFGQRIGSQIKQITAQNSQLIIHLMSETMEKFLLSVMWKEDKIALIEGLIEVEDVHNYYMAAYLLKTLNCKDNYYKETVCALLHCDYPIVRSLVRLTLHSLTEFCNCRASSN